jgi:hypothetical protein
MMGMTLPDLPTSTSEDNVNLGEKDSIRRRALWALEGKPDVSFNKVEIPDISTPDVEKTMFDFTSKTTLSFANSLIGSKRDSFKLLAASSSSKDQLHTLVEEEEEEECEVDSQEDLTVSSSSTNAIKENLPPTLAVTKATPSKPRPSTLNLKPLSLTPDNLHITPTLPSPTPTPDNSRAGLRTLTLSPSSSVDENSPSELKQSRRSSLMMSRRPVLNLALEQLEKSTRDDEAKGLRRSSISYKRSSTGVITNNAGLPTPEMTPTFGRRYSSASNSDRESVMSLGFGNVPNSAPLTAADDEFFPAQQTSTQTRPLSVSEQHFLVKSHNALLARITDLERALTMRRRESSGAFSTSTGGYSRPTSVASSSPGSPPQTHSASTSLSEPSDEMLNLIADLKAERDELKRDVDGWRTRVGDMDSQLTILAKRIENERRDAWVARSRAGLLEIEKEALSSKLTAAEQAHAALLEKEAELKAQWEVERQKLIAKEAETQRRMDEVEVELERVKQELEMAKQTQEMSIRVETVDPLATPTPRSFDAYTRPATAAFGVAKHGLGFMSVDSESSVTDVESSDGNSFRLKTVGEESESEHEDNSHFYSEEDEEDDNGLRGYEDEEDTDMSLQTSSSFDSDEDLHTAYVHSDVAHNLGMPPSPTTPTSQEVFTPPRSHARRATLSKTWTFPFGAQRQPTTAPKAQADEDNTQDKFFGCLDDTESEASGSMPSSPSAYSYEKSKSAFASGFKFAGANDNASFFLPGLGFPSGEEVEQEENQGLEVVAEEPEEESSLDTEETDSDVEDDEDAFAGACGISFTFTPPQDDEVKEEPPQIQVTSPTKRTSPPPTLPAFDFGFGDEEEQEESKNVIPFNFGRPLVEERQPPSPPAQASETPVAFPIITTPPSARPTSPSRIPAPSSSSSIPRLVSFSPKSGADTSMSTPTKIARSPFVTPPTKRGGASPSFIPQPVSSPSPLRTGTFTRPKAVLPTPTFIPQPTRKPVPFVEAESSGNSNVPSVMSAAMNMSPSASFRRSAENNDVSQSSAAAPTPFYSLFGHDGERNTRTSSAQMKSVDLSSHDHSSSTSSSGSLSNTAIPASSGLKSPLSFFGSRRSFQTISNFIPKAWAAPASSSQPSSASHHTSSLSEQTVVPEQPSPRVEPAPLPTPGGYVSREKQLRKLQLRMEVEGKSQMSYLTNVDCRNCITALVHI